MTEHIGSERTGTERVGHGPKGRRPSTRVFAAIALAVALLLAGVASHYASSSPDGLEHVAAAQGFEGTARDSRAAHGPLSDYRVKGVTDERLSGGLAGVAGIGLTGLLMGGLVLALRRRGSPSRSTGADRTAPRTSEDETAAASRP